MCSKNVELMPPPSPYKGISFYGPEDEMIFTARDDDVLKCAKIIGEMSTRILILQGRTGCGKSSFLRAGFIPFLEKPEHGFRFIKDEKAKAKALFIRSTRNPSTKLSESVYEFASEGYVVKTPEGISRIDLTPALLGIEKREDFVEDIGSDSKRMLTALGILSSLIPTTLILIIDQAEEVMTSGYNAEDQHLRDNYFKFLAAFSSEKIDMRILIAIRTEWYGLFYNGIRKWDWQPQNIREYLLDDLSESQIALAIKHPSTINQYGFSYEEGLPDKIAADLMENPQQGGILPVMQIICGKLYERVKKKKSKSCIITKEDYSKLGGAKRQLAEYLEDVLLKLCRLHSAPTFEVNKWYKVLDMLVKVQVDGTVTTELKSEQELKNKALSLKCRIRFDKAMNYLLEDTNRIVQRTNIFNLISNETIVCYSLGHDAVGLALTARRLITEGISKFEKTLKRTSLFTGLFLIIIATILLSSHKLFGFLSLHSEFISALSFITILYGLIFLVFYIKPGYLRPIFRIQKRLLKVLTEKREKEDE